MFVPAQFLSNISTQSLCEKIICSRFLNQNRKIFHPCTKLISPGVITFVVGSASLRVHLPWRKLNIWRTTEDLDLLSRAWVWKMNQLSSNSKQNECMTNEHLSSHDFRDAFELNSWNSWNSQTTSTPKGGLNWVKRVLIRQLTRVNEVEWRVATTWSKTDYCNLRLILALTFGITFGITFGTRPTRPTSWSRGRSRSGPTRRSGSSAVHITFNSNYSIGGHSTMRLNSCDWLVAWAIMSAARCGSCTTLAAAREFVEAKAWNDQGTLAHCSIRC